MSYQLGIDFGTTSVAAAIRRTGAHVAEVVPLAGNGATVPAVMHLARDGAVTVGDGASRLAGIDPGHVVRAPKRRLGDPTPVVVGRASWTAEELSARLVHWVVDRVAAREGGPAEQVALAHPAPWPASVLERLAAALADLGVAVTFVSEPEAVAVAHAAGTVLAGGAPADTVAVYDLGGGRFDAAVLRRDDATGGFSLRGRPEGLDDVGGLDADDLVWAHVRPDLPEGVVLDARVRRACLRAKEALSTKTEVVVRVRRGELAGEVRLRRGTFEHLITPHVDRTVAVLRRVLVSSGTTAADLDTVLVVGGASRIPFVARTVSAQLGRPVTVLDAPELLVARGAVLALPLPAGAAGDGSATAVDAPTVLLSVPAAPSATPAPQDAPADAPEAVAAHAGEPQPHAGAPETAVVPDATDTPDEPPAAPQEATAPQAADEVPAQPAVPPVRVPAVLETVSRRRDRAPSVPRLLVGAAAVVVAALVVVALFRPDGPLDPPLDPTADAGARTTAAPALAGRAASQPAVEGIRDDAAITHDDAAAGGFRAEGAAAAVVIPEGYTRTRTADGRPTAVDTTPAPAPALRTTDAPAARPTATRGSGRPAGAAPRTPPTPVPPRL